MKKIRLQMWCTTLVLCLAGVSAHASHRVMLFNQKATDKILDMWPDYVQAVDNQKRGMEKPGERGIITQSPLRSYLGQLLRQQPTPEQYGVGFKMLVKNVYHPSGKTMFGSRLNTHDQVTAYEYLLRKDGRLPIRFAFSLDLARQPMSPSGARGFYENMGAQWQTINYNPWLWLHGMSSEGDWDAPNRGCEGPDLPVKPGVDEHEVKDVLEICPDFTAPTVQALMRGLRSGWRFAGVHGVGSNAIRLFVQHLEEAMAKNPSLTLDYVRSMRNGFAHGTLTGAVPEVVAMEKKYNLYIPINVRRSLAIEPDNIRAHYGEPGWKFLAPVKTLLDDGVKVVGEGEQGGDPHTYFRLFDVYVNREIAKGDDPGRGPPKKAGEGIVYEANEGVDRVVALKLFTRRSAEFLMAESKAGTLEPGKFADFIVAERDYLKGPDSEIKNNKVIMTVQADQIVYDDPAYKPSIKGSASHDALEFSQYPDTIYTNAHIISLDDHKMDSNPGTIAQAMAVQREIIMKLGSNREIERMAGPKTRIVDLKGKTVLPGIVESHIHPMGPSENYARKIFHLRNTPEGYALKMSVGATPDETMAKVGRAMKLLLSRVKPKPDDWIDISLLHNPELGYATPADVSVMMSTPKIADMKITRADISEIVPNYPFVLSSASDVLSAPEKNAWYYITAGPDGQPVVKKVVDFKE